MIPPNIAMLHPQMDELCAQLKLKSDEWFAKRGIEVFDKGMCWLLNKAKGTDNNHWNILCNSTLIAKHGYLLSLPPIKLYQLNSKNPCIRLSQSQLVEKVKGHMVCVCWPYAKYGEPVFHTQYRISTNVSDMTMCTILSEAKKRFLAQIDFKHLHKETNHTFTFQYDLDNIYLVHARNMVSLHEYDEDELDDLAEAIFADRPARVLAALDYETIYKIVNKSKKLYIIRDNETGERADVTIPVSRSKLVGTLMWKYLIPYWITDERFHIELAYPAAKDKFDRMDEMARKRAGYLCEMARRWSACNLSPQGLAESLRHSNAAGWSMRIIIKLCKLPADQWETVAMDELHKMSPRKLAAVLGLTDY